MARLLDCACPKCGVRLQVRQSSIGSIVRCKNCGEKLNVQPSQIVQTPKVLGCAGCGVILLGLIAIFSIVKSPGTPATNGPNETATRVPNTPASQSSQTLPPPKIQPNPSTTTGDNGSKLVQPAESTIVSPNEILPQVTKGEEAVEPTATEAEEKSASSRFRTVKELTEKKGFMSLNLRRSLEDMVKKYPNTKAAKEARDFLSKYPEK